MTVPRIVLLALALGACASAPERGGTATAVVHDATGARLGTLVLTPTEGGTRVQGSLTGVPDGVHALHIHAVGDCTPPFTSAGPHFNPEGVPHGRATPQGGHAGDLPNVTSLAGRVAVDVLAPASLRGVNAILDADGAAIVLHESADDERTDPAGNAGARIACGVIR